MELRPPPLRLRPARAPPRDPGNAADHCQGGERDASRKRSSTDRGERPFL